jgi:hypothetical protein
MDLNKARELLFDIETNLHADFMYGVSPLIWSDINQLKKLLEDDHETQTTPKNKTRPDFDW